MIQSDVRRVDNSQMQLGEMPCRAKIKQCHIVSCRRRNGLPHGGDLLLGAYNFLDLTPKGRNEKEIMDWVKRNDEYEAAAQSGCHTQTRTNAA